jgi:uncharacterized protein (TIGR00251 family)
VAIGRDPGPVAVLPHPDGALLPLRVSAGAARDRIAGPRGDRLKVSVRAAPERGKANRAVLDLLARSLSVPRGDLRLTAGETSPDKTVLFEGIDPADLRVRLAAALGRRP